MIASGVGFVASKQQALKSTDPTSAGIGYLPSYTDFQSYDTITLQLGEKNVVAELAVSSVERVKGLSGRPTLADNEGLFFVFPHDSRHGIWMKDMRFAIDIIWLDHNLRIVDIAREVSPETFPKVFEPKGDSRYVLEVPHGFSDLASITINTQVHITSVEQKQ